MKFSVLICLTLLLAGVLAQEAELGLDAFELTLGLDERREGTRKHNISATGYASTRVSTKYMDIGAGHGHESSNAMAWLDYLNPTGIRMFVQGITDWGDFVGTKFGYSFDNKLVQTETSFKAAVDNMRSKSNAKGKLEFFKWLGTQKTIDWAKMLRRLNTTDPSSNFRWFGNPKTTLSRLNAKGYRSLGVWHVTCQVFELTSMDASKSTYWKERWELYRNFYVGGRFFASVGVEHIELYNEPDLEEGGCLDGGRWEDEYKIRSMAFQHAFADYSKYRGSTMRPTLIAPPVASASGNLNMFSKTAVSSIHETFPGNATVRTWNNMNVFSYHQYNVRGSNLRNNHETTRALLRDASRRAGIRTDLPMALTEFSCITKNMAEELKGQDVINMPETAVCIAGQVAWMQGGLDWMSLYKFSQTSTSSTPSGIVKTGIMFGDTENFPYNIGGSSKSAEAYRLLVRKTAGGRRMWNVNVTPAISGINSKVYVVDDGQAYYMYVIVGKDITRQLSINLSKLPGVRPYAPVTASAVSSRYHGEVAELTKLSVSKSLNSTQKPNSVYMYTIPRVPTATKVLYPTADGFIQAGGRSTSVVSKSYPKSLIIRTSTTTTQDYTSVAVLRFTLGATSSQPTTLSTSRIVSATLRLRIYESTNLENQILTVLGTKDEWSESSLAWSKVGSLKTLTNGKGVTSISRNFINWSKGVSVVGHVTIADKTKSTGNYVRVDVTDYLKNGGKSFMIARMHRFDRRGSGSSALPGDVCQGTVVFSSREAQYPENRPALEIVYSV